jgi:hypothetical protein
MDIDHESKISGTPKECNGTLGERNLHLVVAKILARKARKGAIAMHAILKKSREAKEALSHVGTIEISIERSKG